MSEETTEKEKLIRQKLWGWATSEGRPLLKSEAATKICPIMTRKETTYPKGVDHSSALPPMLCQTSDCMAWQEADISGEIHCRCGVLPHGEGVLWSI